MDTNILPESLLDQLALELENHASALNEFASRLQPERANLVDAWCSAAGPLDATQEVERRAQYSHAATLLFDDLASLRAGKETRDYLTRVAEWGAQMSARGVSYERLVQQLMTLRRAELPFILRLYAAGPELQLLFAARDALERAQRTVSAAAYIHAAHDQLRATARTRAVGHLTGGIAHSLNNLLATIYGRTQLLQQMYHDEYLLNDLRTIERAARSAADNLRRVQEFAVAHPDEEMLPLDINQIVADTVALTRYRWRDDAEASGIVIDLVKDLADVPLVRGKRSELRDMLVELILNAVESMPLGGLVTVRTERVGDQVRVSVSDIGEGMDDVTRAHAFDPFFTTKGAGHAGLGLSSAKEIARAHHGTLELQSAFGRGTIATLALPVTHATPPAPQLKLAPEAQPTRILVVDDDASIREIAGKSLQLRGHQVVAAESGPDALRLFREDGSVEVVLTDLGMPGMNGFELARALKKIEPKVMVILMTGWAAELDTKKIRESGIDRAINKPFDVEQVLQLIREARAIREKM